MPDDEPAPLEREILRRLGRSKRKHNLIDKLVRGLDEPRGEIDAAIDALAARGEVVRTRKDRVALAARLGLVAGTVRIGRRGRAIVVPDDGDIPVSLPKNGVRPAMDGDRVIVAVEAYRRGGLRPGKLQRVVARAATKLVGTLHTQSGREPVLVPAGPNRGYLATVEPGGTRAGAGQMVVARILAYPTGHRDPHVRIERVLGPSGSLATEIAAACETMGIPTEFEAATEQEVARLREPSEEDLTERTDLRGELTMTVDPVDARDFDDAIAIHHRQHGFTVTVSIADVSHYVRTGSRLDAEAYERGTSVYFPGHAVPMLPERLSSNLASLRPDEDRLAVSVELSIATDGRVTPKRFFRSVIRSDHRLTYEQAQAILDGKEPTPTALSQALADLAACAEALYQRRLARGAIDLDIPEGVTTVGADGQPVAIARRPRLLAHRIIEELMLAANEAVARRLTAAGIGLLYRVHDPPDEEAAAALTARLSLFGVRLRRSAAELSPAALQDVVRQVEGKPHQRLVHYLVLRAMTQARYDATRGLHFGLAADCYTHFTSPIRRYPDLVVHRALTGVIGGRRKRLPSAESLAPVAEQCSGRERRAMAAERDIDRAAAVLVMQDRIGERFEATVTTVERFGLFVELDEQFVEGFVPVGRMDEYFEYVAERMELLSRSSSRRFRIGDRIVVKLVAADLTNRQLEFEPLRR